MYSTPPLWLRWRWRRQTDALDRCRRHRRRRRCSHYSISRSSSSPVDHFGQRARAWAFAARYVTRKYNQDTQHTHPPTPRDPHNHTLVRLASITLCSKLITYKTGGHPRRFQRLPNPALLQPSYSNQCYIYHLKKLEDQLRPPVIVTNSSCHLCYNKYCLVTTVFILKVYGIIYQK